MRQFLKELLETLSRISTAPGQAPAHGGAGEEEKAKTRLFLIMFREIVRLGELMKDQDVLIDKTTGWADSSPDTIDPQPVTEAAVKQRELSRIAFDVLEKLKPLPGEVVSSLPEAVLEAGQWLQGAADMLDERKFNKALERQRMAMEFLENAYTVMAQSMAPLRQGDQSDESEQEDRRGQPEIGEGDAAGATAEARTDDGKPWYWDLPPRARVAISLSWAQPLPPAYESAIKRYYERLSHRNKDGR